MSDEDARHTTEATPLQASKDDRPTRSIELEQEVDAPPEEVWAALTTGAGLKRWFPLDARVEPGSGGSVWLSWGPGMEGTAQIHAWEPYARFGWTESHGEDESGRPIRVMVDFHVQGRDGRTVVRLVQSGLAASSDWDEMYDALTDGWTYFLFNLAYYLLRHSGRDRRMVWARVATELSRDAVWERLLASALIALPPGVGEPPARVVMDEETTAEVASARPGRHWAGALPELADSLLFVEIEGRHVGFWLSTYAVDDDRVRRLQEALDRRIVAALGG